MSDPVFFDNFGAFVLDIQLVSAIIYIWYEGGKLRPPLVRLLNSASPLPQTDLVIRREVPEATSGMLARITHTKGWIRDNGEESQGREEEGRQETVSRPHPSKKGAAVAPFSTYSQFLPRSFQTHLEFVAPHS